MIAVIIVVSFLSLMSFAEFLRFQWGGAQQQQQQQQQRQRQRQRVGGVRRNVENGAVIIDWEDDGGQGGLADNIIEGDIDEIAMHPDRYHDDDEHDPLAPFLNHLMANDEDSVDDHDYSSGSENEHESERRRRGRRRDFLNGVFGGDGDRGPMNDDDDDDDIDENDIESEAEEDNFEMFMRAQEEQAMMDEENHLHLQHHPNRNPLHDPRRGGDDDEHDMPEIGRQPQQLPRNAANPRQRDNARFEPQFEPLQPAFADIDAVDDGPVSIPWLPYYLFLSFHIPN